MKKLMILLAAAIGFAACESNDEQSNSFEGMPVEEIVQQEGGIDYLIEISKPVDESVLVDLLQGGKVLRQDIIQYCYEDRQWVPHTLIGMSTSYMLLLDENTYRTCWDCSDRGVLFLNGQCVTLVYRNYVYNGDLCEHIWDWMFYDPSNVKVEAYVDDFIFITCTNHYGERVGVLLRVCDDREQIMAEYCNNIEDCSYRPTE